jgi:uncharacterized protein YjbI with pentapeptide repeats
MSEKTSLLASFDYYDGREKAKEELISATSDLIEKEYIIFPLLDANPDKKQEVERRWMKLDNTNNDFEELWIHRWVSLFILNKLIENDEARRSRINEKHKEAVRKLINHSGSLVPTYLKNLRKTDLSHADLSHANLFGADLSGADLSDAKLFRADLSGADLSGAKLCRAEMTDINMSDAILFEAKMSSCVLSRANLSDSDFSVADLSSSKLSYAILSYANLSRSNLSQANLLYANISDANLSDADISEADLSYANLSDATLTCAKIKNCQKFSNLVCYGADFNSIKVENSEKLLEYLKNNHANNVPEPNKKNQDPVPPKVTDTIPSEHCENVPIWESITVNFSHAISNDSINSESFRLYRTEYEHIPCLAPEEGRVSLIWPKHKTAVFLPSRPLYPNTKYTAKISTDVKDYADNRMQSCKKLYFTTSEDPVRDRLPILGIRANGDDGNIPQNATDNNDLNTRWSNIGRGSWIQMDLGERKDISNLQIAWFKGDRRTYTFKVIFSNEREPTDEEANKSRERTSNGGSLSPENYRVKDLIKDQHIENVRTRYITITVNGNSVNNWASVTHISVYGQRN